MTDVPQIDFGASDPGRVLQDGGRVAILMTAEGGLDPAGRRADTALRHGLRRLAASPAWNKLKNGEAMDLVMPAGLAAESLIVVKLPRRPTQAEARRAGAAMARLRGDGALTVHLGSLPRAADLALGLVLRTYAFTARKSAPVPAPGPATILCSAPDAAQSAWAPLRAVAAGVFATRDLVHEPANILTTTEFASRLTGLRDVGVTVEVLEEDALRALGMGSLLCVGQGSASPSKVVVMQWQGSGDAAPVAVIGKGVVFDSGGISIKPAAGMEEMTMDMGGAGVVAGLMRTLALRGARANVVGLVGLVENMPSGTAVRPGDVVTSMKGDTIEVINTDAEGRLVLADVLWYAQERFKPAAMVNLATLTGAIIVALGTENAGLFSNNDALAGQLLAAAGTEGEGLWRMPMGDGYDALLKSSIADMKNIGGRDGGAISAAQFLRRFVKDDVPWAHLDIAGVTLMKADQPLAPKGASGWGVRTLNAWISKHYEAG